MDEASVENAFPSKWYEKRKLILGSSLGEPDRKRMLEHVIADVVFQLLAEPGANPVGLTVTVLVGDSQTENLEVVGTAPQYAPRVTVP